MRKFGNRREAVWSRRRYTIALAAFATLSALLSCPATGVATASPSTGSTTTESTAASSWVIPAGGRFFDDDGNVHEASIEAIANVGITLGCNPPYRTAYCPKAPVTREQMAAFLVRSLGLSDDGGGNHFTDDDGSIFESDIAKLAAAGITRGCNPPVNDRFCPTDYVTRGQMAAFLVRAMGYVEGDGMDLFDDDDGSVFESHIDRLAAAGVTVGCNPPTNTNFCPDDLVTRDQMATFLARALGLSRPPVPPRPTTDSDGEYLNLHADAGDHGCSYANGERCQLTYNVSGEFYVLTGWIDTEWSQEPSSSQANFRSDSVRVEALLDGVALDLYYWGFEVDDNDVATKTWSYIFPDWLDGSHHLEMMWIDEANDLVWTVDATLNGDGPGYGVAAASQADLPQRSEDGYGLLGGDRTAMAVR